MVHDTSSSAFGGLKVRAPWFGPTLIVNLYKYSKYGMVCCILCGDSTLYIINSFFGVSIVAFRK